MTDTTTNTSTNVYIKLACKLNTGLIQVVKSFNPSLYHTPPPANEVSGNDICYLGPNGEHSEDKVVYCKDLPNGMRGMVGSWYLSHERYVWETLLVSLFFYIIFYFLTKTATTNTKIRTNSSLLRPSPFMKLITLVTFMIQLTYKFIGYPYKYLLMLMPCNVLLLMMMILCYYPNLSSTASYTIHQLLICYNGLPFLALINPDVSDCILWMEVPWFFIFHLFIWLFPYYSIFVKCDISSFGSFHDNSCIPTSSSSSLSSSLSSINTTLMITFVQWWIFSCTLFGIFYILIVTPISIWSGLNINYMLHPPSTPGNIISGSHYRLVSTFCCATLFFCSRLCIMLSEGTWNVIQRRCRSNHRGKDMSNNARGKKYL